jgi:predicted DNA-binding transcriptional regulator YafY
MYHPTTRVLAVLEMLQTNARISGTEMARRLEVDGRTLRRYIEMLQDLGIPIVAERGRHGAYSLVPGFKLPPLMFTDDEAIALTLGLHAARGLGLSEAAPAVESARAKLERVLPAPLRGRVRALSESVALDLTNAIGPDMDPAALTILSAGAQQRRRVHFSYRAADGAETERDFDPYGLAFREGRWYVVGHCHLRNGLRSFRLDRVLSVELRDAAFERPADFDTLAHLALNIATLPRALPVEVLLRTDLAMARLEVMGAMGLLEAADDGVLLRGRTDDAAWYAQQLARLPFAFEVRAPDAVREALRQHAQTLLSAAR